MLAEDLATLDILTRGRLVVGVGAGYREDEFTALGIDYAQRFRMFDEAIGIMKQLWTQDVVSFSGGVLVARGGPHPHPPLAAPAPADLDRRDEGPGVRRSARLGDGWPITPETKVPEMVRLLSIYEDERARIGRPQVKHPLRREIIPAATTEAAYQRFESWPRSGCSPMPTDSSRPATPASWRASSATWLARRRSSARQTSASPRSRSSPPSCRSTRSWSAPSGRT